MRQPGVGLPVVLVVTLVISLLALVAAIQLRDFREQRMMDAARTDITAMMDAVDKYQALYSALPHRLIDLDRVGFHESGGMVVCMFSLNESTDAGEPYLDLAIRHRAARMGAWTEYSGDQRMIKFMSIPDCPSARHS